MINLIRSVNKQHYLLHVHLLAVQTTLQSEP